MLKLHFLIGTAAIVLLNSTADAKNITINIPTFAVSTIPGDYFNTPFLNASAIVADWNSGIYSLTYQVMGSVIHPTYQRINGDVIHPNVAINFSITAPGTGLDISTGQSVGQTPESYTTPSFDYSYSGTDDAFVYTFTYRPDQSGLLQPPFADLNLALRNKFSLLPFFFEFPVPALIDPGSVNISSVTLSISDRIAAVPEPASWALMISGFGLVGVATRRRTIAKSQLRRASASKHGADTAA